MKYRFENVKCLQVLDGDTIEAEINIGFYLVTTQRFRLNRINAPETRTRDEEEKTRGFSSKEFLTQTILGKEIILETHKAGKFGRWLAEVYFEDMNINDQMVENGHAKYKEY